MGIEQLPEHFYKRSTQATDELGVGWADLLGVEFEVFKSISRLERLLGAARKSEHSKRQVLEYWLEEVRDDFRGYTQEYIDKKPLTPVSYEGRVASGQTQLPLISHNFRFTKGRDINWNTNAYFEIRGQINREERGGAVRTGWEILEQLAAQAAVGDLLLLTSPKGPTGLPKPAVYPTSRTYILQVIDDVVEVGSTSRIIKGYDIESDFELAEHRQFLNTFLPADTQISEQVDPAAFVRQPALIKKSHRFHSIVDVVGVMEAIRLQQGKRNISERHTFADIYQQLFDNSLQSLDPRYREIFTLFTEVVLAPGTRVQSEIKEALALLILEAFGVRDLNLQRTLQKPLVKIIEAPSVHIRNYIPIRPEYSDPYELDVQANPYQQLMRQAQQAGGSCPSTRKGDGIFADPIQELLTELEIPGIKGNPAIPGVGGVTESNDDYKNDSSLCKHCGKESSPHFHCPDCDRPIVVGKGITRCQCGKGKTC